MKSGDFTFDREDHFDFVDQVEWGESSRCFDSGVICPKRKVQLVVLVRVVFVDGSLQHSLQKFVDCLGLFISLRVVRCSELMEKTE